MPAPASDVDTTWYSLDIAGVHWITLSNYHPFAAGSPQYNWLKVDLAAIDRTTTPWVFVNTHAPWWVNLHLILIFLPRFLHLEHFFFTCTSYTPLSFYIKTGTTLIAHTKVTGRLSEWPWRRCCTMLVWMACSWGTVSDILRLLQSWG